MDRCHIGLNGVAELVGDDAVDGAAVHVGLNGMGVMTLSHRGSLFVWRNGLQE